MARIYEYQGKEVLKKFGISIPKGRCVSTPEEARKVAEDIGNPVVIKAQVWTTGRFKAGGILFANNPGEAESAAKKIIGTRIKGLPVTKVLIEERIRIEKEFYVGVIVSNSYKIKGPVILFSIEGGVGVEEVAAKNPDKVATLNVDYLKGVESKEAEELLSKLSFDEVVSEDVILQLKNIICGLYKAFKECDARVAEINPLVLGRDGIVYAADCRFTIDDNSVFRHPEFGIRLPRDMERPPTELEEIAWTIEEDDYRGTGYFTQMYPEIQGKGWLGFHGIGGGGAMLGASAFVERGFKIANYADTSGDPTASKVYRVIKAIFSQPIDGYVLMGACLANQEQWHHAHAIVKALREEADKRPGFPVVILLAGNKEQEAHEIIRKGLKDTSLQWELYGRDFIYDTDFIANRVQELVSRYQEIKYNKGEELGLHGK